MPNKKPEQIAGDATSVNREKEERYYVSLSEKRMIEKAARLSGVKKSEYVRRIVMPQVLQDLESNNIPVPADLDFWRREGRRPAVAEPLPTKVRRLAAELQEAGQQLEKMSASEKPA